jgi:hypothetical protein
MRLPEFGEEGWGDSLLELWEQENYHTESYALGSLIDVLPDILELVKNQEDTELEIRLRQAVSEMERIGP